MWNTSLIMGTKWKVMVPVLVVVGVLGLVVVLASTGDSPSGGSGTTDTAIESDGSGQGDSGAAPDIGPGTYEISAQVSGQCGTYDVFLLAGLSVDGNVTLDKLFTAGGEVFESATGSWESLTAVATFADDSLFDAWVLRFDQADELTIYNVYGPSSPVVSSGIDVDFADFAGVDSPEKLDEVTAGGVDACVSEVSGVKASFAPLP